MAFTSATKLLIDFDETAPTDSVSGNPLLVVGSNQIVTLLDNGLGFSMNAQQYLRAESVSLSVTNAMTIGFWLKSTNPGFAQDIDGTFSPMRIAVLDVIGVLNVPIIIIYETTSKDGNNKMNVDIGNTAFTATSVSYSVGTWHHFWITYDGASSEVKIFVDGVSRSITTTGSIPASLNGATGVVSINRLALGSNFDSVLNQGDIDDVVVLNNEEDTGTTIQKVINYSLDFAFDTTFADREEVDQVFLFNDPDVFQLTAVQDDGTSIFATRSDGKILEGSPVFWEVRRKFQSENEVDSLSAFGSGIEQQNGFLEISGNATVSI